jgi:glycosyltransferase involved in cell wall biosynthesis
VRAALIGPVPPHLGGATPGGVATHQVHLAAGLASAGIKAPLLATNTRVAPADWTARGGEAPFPLYRMGRPGGDRRHYLAAVGAQRVARYAVYLALRPPDGSRREQLANLLWYRYFLAAVQPEIIHVQHPLERATYVGMVQQLESWRLPVVVTAHSLFGEHDETAIETLMAPNLRAADRVIAVSGHIADQAMQLGVDPKRIRVIRSGVDVERFSLRDRAAARRALGVDLATRLVLFVGNLEPRKQLDVLLRAMVEVRRKIDATELIVVGSGESAGAQDQSTALMRLTRDLELSEAVHFVGRVDDQQLLDCYAAADVFALPSSSEAQGIVALEAMACGLPVVASAVGGLLETIDDGRTGHLVKAGDALALAHGLLALLEDEPHRQSIAAAARQTVERDFSWARSIAATVEVYQEVVGHA